MKSIDSLDALLDELDSVREMPESDVCALFGTDSKEEYIELLLNEISYRKELYDEELERMREEEEIECSYANRERFALIW